MAKYCVNCGKELIENADVCINCGKLVEKLEQKKSKKLGFSIASMILGIVALLWTLMELISVGEIETEIYMNHYYQLAEIIGVAIGYTLFALIPSILGVIFAIISLKKQRNGFNISGIVLNIISLIPNLIIFIYILTIY